MTSEEDRERSRRRRINLEKAQKERADRKGAFSMKPVNPKKESYKREKINVKDIYKLESQSDE